MLYNLNIYIYIKNIHKRYVYIFSKEVWKSNFRIIDRCSDNCEKSQRKERVREEKDSEEKKSEEKESEERRSRCAKR